MSYPAGAPDGPPDRGHEPGGYLVPNGQQPPRPPSPGSRIGRVTGVEMRQESHRGGENVGYSITVLASRLSEPGHPQPMDVQLRGRTLAGTIGEGDWVEVSGPPDPTGRWDLARVQNLTTASTVYVVGGRRTKAGTVVTLVFLGLIALVGLLVVIGVVVALSTS